MYSSPINQFNYLYIPIELGWESWLSASSRVCLNLLLFFQETMGSLATSLKATNWGRSQSFVVTTKDMHLTKTKGTPLLKVTINWWKLQNIEHNNKRHLCKSKEDCISTRNTPTPILYYLQCMASTSLWHIIWNVIYIYTSHVNPLQLLYTWNVIILLLHMVIKEPIGNLSWMMSMSSALTSSS